MTLYKGPEEYRQMCYNQNLAMPNVQNVLVAAIYLGIYLGYQTIELYGVEHSWTKNLYVNNENYVCINDNHFFDKDKIQDTYMLNVDGSHTKFHEVLREYADMFESYWELHKIAAEHQCRIVNMTPGSFIDAFERQQND